MGQKRQTISSANGRRRRSAGGAIGGGGSEFVDPEAAPGDLNQEPGRDILSPIDPQKYAGEGFGAIDEYAVPGDIESPYVRGDIAGEGIPFAPPVQGQETEEEYMLRMFGKL